MKKKNTKNDSGQMTFADFDASPEAAETPSVPPTHRPALPRDAGADDAGTQQTGAKTDQADSAEVNLPKTGSPKPSPQQRSRPQQKLSPQEKAERNQAVGVADGSLPAVLQREIVPADDEPTPDLTGKLVVVVDAHSLIYQVFHALPPMTSGSGLPVAAVFGFVGDMLELIARKQPDYLIAAFDKGAITFRNDLYDQYKAHRESMPDELRQQIPLIRQAIDAMGIGIMEQAGFEADDLVAMVAAKVEAAGGRCIIVTSDKDCRQLITDQVSLYNIRKDQEMNAAELWDVWGVRPDQVVDFQALVGDPVDNVPGVPLIGPKLAQQLLEQFGTLEEILDNAESISGKKRKQNLLEGRERAMLSRQLVRLDANVQSPIPWSRSHRGAADLDRAQALFEEFGFRRLKSRTVELLGDGESAPPEVQWETNYRCITSVDELHELVSMLGDLDEIAIDTETTGTNPRASQLVGLSIAWAKGQAAYIPVRAPAGDPQLDQATVIDVLRPIIEAPGIQKIGQNLKFEAVVLRSGGAILRGVATDTMVADYLLNPGGRNHTLDDLARRYLNHTTTKIKELIGTGKKQKRMDEVPVELVTDYACEDVDVPLRIAPQIRQQLVNQGLESLYRDLEMPLIDVLAEMEFNGIDVDAEHLRRMSSEFTTQIETLREEIFQLAGRTFNVDSPKQLGEVMFSELNLPVIRKTKTGASTDAAVLQQLSIDHELPAKVLDYRQATKLKNTYIDALPQLICQSTGRIHTSFRQDVAATGRLSSTEPNLQNIPIRTQQGKAIRAAFTAGREGWLLLGADYSQIELRVLAHYSGDPALLAAYQQDADIHTRVAAEVHGVAEADVTSDMRRVAKTINFGIVYGQSPFGLAKTLSIPQEQARDYIEVYFQRYAGVEAFMLKTLSDCRQNGYVSTMLGRRRDIQGVRDLARLEPHKRRSLTEAERVAINMPIQGTAADLIKLAMLAVHRRLAESGLQARLLLQIHDELLFEVAAADADELAELVRQEMTSVIELDVPLKVDVAVGKTWAET